MKAVLIQRLGHLVGLKRRFHAAHAAILALLAVAVLAGLAAGLDCLLVLPAGVRLAVLGLAALAVAAAAGWFLVRPTLGFDRHRAAQAVEAANPALGQLVRTALELAEPPPDAAPCHPALAKHLQEQAAESLTAAGTAAIAPWRTLRQVGGGLLALLAILAILAASSGDFRTALRRLAQPTAQINFTDIAIEASTPAAPTGAKVTVRAKLSGRILPGASLRLAQTQDPAAIDTVKMVQTAPGQFSAAFDMPPYSLQATVVSGDGHSQALSIRHVLPLQLRETCAIVTPPPYTQLPPATIKPADVIRAPQGSGLVFAAILSNPLREAAIQLGSGTLLPTTLQESRIQASLPVPGVKMETFKIAARDTDGQELQSPLFRIEPVQDAPPAVAFITPAADLEASPLEELPLRVRFKDNYGLKSATILLVIDGQEQTLATRTFTAESKTREISLDANLLLEKHGLSINSNVKLYAAATDHNPQARGRAVSPPLAIDIRQLQTFTKKAGDPPPGGEPPPEQQQLMQIEEIIRLQRQINSLTFVGAERDDPENAAATGAPLAERQDKLRDETRKLAEAMRQKAPQNAEPVSKAAEEMDQAAGQLRTGAMRPALAAEEAALSDLLKTRQELIKQLQKKQKSKSQSKQQKKEDGQKAAGDLAAKLEALAQDEDAIRRQIPPEAPPPTTLPAQQEQLNSKLSEVEEDILGNESMSGLVKQRARELQETAEATKQAIDTALRKPEAAARREARQQVETTRQRLQELAEHVRAMDADNLSEAIGKSSEMAKELSEQVNASKKDPQKPPEAGKKDGQEAQGQPKDGQDAGKDAEQQAQEAERKAATLADLLNQAPELAKESDPGLAERLEEIRKEFNPNAIPQDVGEALRTPEAKPKAELGERLGQLSKRLGEEHQRATTSMLDKLSQAEKEAGKLKKESEKGQPPGGQKPGEPKPGEPKPGEKPGPGPGGKQPGGEPKPGAENQDESQNMTPEERMAKLARALKAMQDQQLKELGQQLAQAAAGGGGEAEYQPGKGGVLPTALLAEIQNRLRQRIAEELKKNILRTQEHPVPPAYRRLVEQYYQSLSDDIEE